MHARRAAVALAACAAALAAPAAATVVPAHVTPAAGTPTTTFAVTFVSPTRTGVIGSKRFAETLDVSTAPHAASCIAQASVSLPPAARGALVHARLVPAVRGGRWCVGRYTGKVVELQTAVCPRGTMCPTYVRLLGTVARFAFVVHR